MAKRRKTRRSRRTSRRSLRGLAGFAAMPATSASTLAFLPSGRIPWLYVALGAAAFYLYKNRSQDAAIESVGGLNATTTIEEMNGLGSLGFSFKKLRKVAKGVATGGASLLPKSAMKAVATGGASSIAGKVGAKNFMTGGMTTLAQRIGASRGRKIGWGTATGGASLFRR
jgi:hypothetical protein